MIYFERTDRYTGKKLIGQINTGLRRNYILQKQVEHGELFELQKPFLVQTYSGRTKITHFVIVNLFSHDLMFHIVDSLNNFDLVLGMNGLHETNAIINVMSLRLSFKTKKEFREKLINNENQSTALQEKMRKVRVSKNVSPLLTKIQPKAKMESNRSPKLSYSKNNAFPLKEALRKQVFVALHKFIRRVNFHGYFLRDVKSVLLDFKQTKYFLKKFIKVSL